MGRRSRLTAVLLALLAGCGERLGDARQTDRLAVLRACSERSIIAALPKEPAELLSGLRSLEACMALRHLRGRATYDPSKNAVRFAYEAERPSLRF
jgi:hypothetical protein